MKVQPFADATKSDGETCSISEMQFLVNEIRAH